MSGTNEKQPPSNFQNDYTLDLLETEKDCRSLIASRNPQEAVRLGKITFLRLDCYNIRVGKPHIDACVVLNRRRRFVT